MFTTDPNLWLAPGWFERMESTFYQALDVFIKKVEKVEGEETAYRTLMDGLKAQMIAEAAYESLKTNKPVQIDHWQPE